MMKTNITMFDLESQFANKHKTDFTNTQMSCVYQQNNQTGRPNLF